MIKAAKWAISAILQDADVTDEELQTCFTGVQSLLNSRPLTTISDDPNDEPVLTPNHFIIGQMDGDIVPDSVQPSSTMETDSRAHSSRMATMDERISSTHRFPTRVVL